MKTRIRDLGIIIAAGGSGSRFVGAGKNKSKLLITLPDSMRKSYGFTTYPADMPLFLYSVLAFRGICPDKNFVIVVKREDLSKFEESIHQFIPKTELKLITGGKTRMHSVYNGLKVLDKSVKFAAIHDAARPFATRQLLKECLDSARKYDGAVTAKRMTDTVKAADKNGFVVKTVDRSVLWRVETPQIFPAKKLISAYEKAFKLGLDATDDSGIMEYAGHRPYLFEYSGDNRKITYSVTNE